MSRSLSPTLSITTITKLDLLNTCIVCKIINQGHVNIIFMFIKYVNFASQQQTATKSIVEVQLMFGRLCKKCSIFYMGEPGVTIDNSQHGHFAFKFELKYFLKNLPRSPVGVWPGVAGGAGGGAG